MNYPTIIYYVANSTDVSFEPVHFTTVADAELYKQFCIRQRGIRGHDNDFVVRQATLFTNANSVTEGHFRYVANDVLRRLSPMEREALERHFQSVPETQKAADPS